MRSLGSRIERDPELTPEVKADVTRLLVAWRRNQAQASEKLAEAMIDSPSSVGMFGMGSESEALDSARRALRDVGNNTLKEIASKLGPNSAKYVVSFDGYEEDGSQVELYRVATAPQSEGAAAESADIADAVRRSQFVDGGSLSIPDALTAADVIRVGRTLALDSTSQSVVEALVDGWKATQWDVQMTPVATRITEAGAKRKSVDNEGSLVWDESASRIYEEARAQAAELVFALDEKLYADLATALGLENDAPLLTLLRLERTDLAVSRTSQGMMATGGTPLPLSRIIASSSIDPAVTKAVLEGAKAELQAITSTLPARVRARIELTKNQEQVQRAFSSRDEVAIERASSEYGALMMKAVNEDQAFGALLTKTFVDAFAAHAGDAANAESLRFEVLRTTYPEIYKRSENAQTQFDAAKRLPALTEDQRARIEALAAEYAAVYDKLSSEMITPSDVLPYGGAVDEAQWAEYQKRAELVEKARFARKERTEKARAELRRILGLEVARTIPGLIKDEDVATTDSDDMNPWMNREED